MAIILGIDPGSRVTGFGVIHIKAGTREIQYVGSGCIKTSSASQITHRLGIIFEGIRDIIESYRPDEVAIEQVFLKQNVMSALKLGHARGAAMVACSQYALDVFEYAPRVIKKAVVGYGAAEKSQVQMMIVDLLRLQQAPSSDAADALAIAVCHGFHQTYTYRGVET
jgi:crossover junction endodeoxyribonuclease RuvC